MTSNTAPYEQRTSLASPAPLRTCMPRITPAADRDTLSCANPSGSIPAPRMTCASKVRQKKPRSSTCGDGVNNSAPAMRGTARTCTDIPLVSQAAGSGAGHVKDASPVLVVRPALPGGEVNLRSLLIDHELPRAVVDVVGEAVVLMERDALLDGRPLIGAPGRVAPVLGEEPVESALGLGGAVYPQGLRVEVEDVVVNRDVLGLPPAVRDVGLLGDQRGTAGAQPHGGIDQRAGAAAGVGRRVAEPVGVLPEDHAAPVVGEGVLGDRQGRAVQAGHPAVRAGLGDVDRAGREARVGGAVAQAVAGERVVLDQGVIADLVGQPGAVVVGDVIALDVEAAVVGV